MLFLFQAEDGIRDKGMWLEFRRVLFRSLPKTRSGKIMRRILRKIAENDIGSMGDISTLADPSVVDDLVHNRANKWKTHSKSD